MSYLDYGNLPDYVDPKDNPTSISIGFDEVDDLHLRVGAMCLRFKYDDDLTVKIMASIRQTALKAKQCMTESSICFNPENPPIKAAVDFNNKLKIAIAMTGWKPSELLKKLKPDILAKLKELEQRITSPSTP